MLRIVEHYIRENQMLQKGSFVVTGVSGGADSVCLLWVLKELQVKYRLRLLAVHIHHGIRGKEADEDAEFVRVLCEEWNVPMRLIRLNVPALAKCRRMSEEEAGRYARYKVLEEIRGENKADFIAVAHHKDDNAETILWNMLRGSGLLGLSGMKPVRDYIIRPLLCVDRGQIEMFLKQHNISWRTDSTNLETGYTRNKLRLQLIPWMEENLVPGLKDRLVEEACIFREANEYLQYQAEQFIRIYRKEYECYVEFPLEAVRDANPAVMRYVLRTSIKDLTGSLKDITAAHIQSVMQLEGVGKSIDLPYHISAKLGYEKLYLGCLEELENTEADIGWYEMKCRVFPRKKEEKIPKSIYTKWFDYDKINDTVRLRTRKMGDRIQVLPGKGSKKLKDYMIDAKIPKEIRDQVPVIADGADILWVIGYRISEAYKVTEDTVAILQIDILKCSPAGKRSSVGKLGPDVSEKENE